MPLNPNAPPFFLRRPPPFAAASAAASVWFSVCYFHHGHLRLPPPPSAPPSTAAEKKEEAEKIVGGENNTTVMIKNIPNRIKREDLVKLLETHCYEENKKSVDIVSAFDFVYLPMDFRSGSNLGYAFVNMTNREGAKRIKERMNNYRWSVHNTKKIWKVKNAKIQGKEALLRHFHNSIFFCNNPDFLPLSFSPPRSPPNPPSSPTILGKCVGFNNNFINFK